MPRTKITKNSKRNREVANREEKIRVYEIKMDSVLLSVDDVEVRYKSIVDNQLRVIESLLQTELREMKMNDFLDVLLKLEHFSDFKASDQTQQVASQSMCSNTTTVAPTATSSRNDEGYLTEDSTNSACTMSSYANSMLRSVKAMRTPGPLHSARARRERRSRSACGSSKVLASANAATSSTSSSNTQRHSRSKMRTPMASRTKAFSADRTPRQMRKSSPGTPPMAFLRWPKPGEVALSKFGSPIVAQVLPDKFANVNIPIRNGVLSLRPKKLAEVRADLIENLDADTLSQIRTLHENLQMIVNTANKAGLK